MENPDLVSAAKRRVKTDGMENSDLEVPLPLPLPEAKKMKIIADLDGDDVMSTGTEDLDKVYFCFTQVRQFDFHVLNINTGTFTQIEELSNRDLPISFGFTVHESKIYLIGGLWLTRLNTPIKEVIVFNTLTNDLENIPSMKEGRVQPLVVPFKGNIYVFGGSTSSTLTAPTMEPWAEYYNPKLNVWFSLPNPPKEVYSCLRYYGRAVYEGGDGIILWNESVFCILSRITSSEPIWQFFPVAYSNYEACIYADIHDVAVVDDVLYWSWLQNIYAVDLAQNKTCANPIYTAQLDSDTILSIKSNMYYSSRPPFVVAMGKDHLCVIWSEVKDAMPDNYKKIKVSWQNFRVQKVHNPTKTMGFLVHPTSSVHSHIVDCFDIYKISGMQWEHDDNHKHAPNREGEGQWQYVDKDFHDLLRILQRTMSLNSYNTIYHLIKAEESQTQAEIPLENFLKDLGLDECLEIFETQNISMAALKSFTCQELKALKLPLGARITLLLALKSSKCIRLF